MSTDADWSEALAAFDAPARVGQSTAQADPGGTRRAAPKPSYELHLKGLRRVGLERLAVPESLLKSPAQVLLEEVHGTSSPRTPCG